MFTLILTAQLFFDKKFVACFSSMKISFCFPILIMNLPKVEICLTGHQHLWHAKDFFMKFFFLLCLAI